MKISHSVRKKNIASLNVYGAVAAFFVILLHVYPYDNAVWKYIAPYARLAVPFFFMRSGYFTYNESISVQKEKLRKHIITLLKLIFLSNLLYFVIGVVNGLANDSLPLFLRETFTAENLALLLVFNMPSYANHLWYLNACLYVLLIYLFLLKFKGIEKYYKYIALILFLISCVPAYSRLLPFGPLHPVLTRNFLFTGLPFFMAGILIRRHGEFSIKGLPCWIAAAGLGLAAESVFLNAAGLFTKADMFLFIGPLIILLFIFAIKHPNLGRGRFLDYVGEKYSMYIYVIHFVIAKLLLQYNEAYLYWLWSPLAAFAISLALSVAYVSFRKLICGKALLREKKA